jgi:dCTP deaminase
MDVCGPASYDLHLGETLLGWPSGVVRDPRIDQSEVWELKQLRADGTWVLEPGMFYLGATRERVGIPNDLVGQLEGRSSWGRLGLEIHRCAGYIDPGFQGHPTLELSVVGAPLVIWPGARICQLVLTLLTSPAVRPYRGKYHGDDGPVASRLHLDHDIAKGATMSEERHVGCLFCGTDDCVCEKTDAATVEA